MLKKTFRKFKEPEDHYSVTDLLHLQNYQAYSSRDFNRFSDMLVMLLYFFFCKAVTFLSKSVI